MYVALAVHRVTRDRKDTLRRLVEHLHDAADRHADLVVFSETALTGFVATDNPISDLRLGEPIPGPTLEVLAAAARNRGIWVCLGLYERDGGVLYDAAILLDSDGQVHLKHRRSDGRWHFRGADTSVYGKGAGPAIAETPWGAIGLLLCGELMSNHHVDAVRRLAPKYLLVPFARGYDEDAPDDSSWYEDNLPSYAAQAQAVGATTLMVNYLNQDGNHGNGCFGGAIAIDKDGVVLEHKPLHEEGLLLVEV